MDVTLIEDLRSRLLGALPGHGKFLAHTGYDRTRLKRAQERDTEPRISAVLICLYPSQGEWYTTLMKRPSYEGVHSGQVAFPGGRVEEEDKDLIDTALREFREETGADTQGFEILGNLSELYIPPSRSLVTPYIACVDRELVFDPDEREVARLMEVPFTDVLKEDILKSTDQLIWALGKELQVPYFDIDNEIVWGATALMIAELRELCGVELKQP